MQIARGHTAGVGDTRGRKVRVRQVRFNVVQDAHQVCRSQRAAVRARVRRGRIRTADEVEDGAGDAAR